tara:strand:- start:695 stop:1306 length:612 start_codon:yes stop_codon:yes gene_type:complete
MNKFFAFFILFVASFYLMSCNRGVEDTSELWAKNQSRQAIIDRSGTTFQAGSDKDAKERQMNDAQNRLRTGGGLLGKKPTELKDLLGSGKDQQTASIGMPINPYLWKASLETLEFMPFASADPFAGVIITDWYTSQNKIDERCKINVFIKGVDLKTDNLKVNAFCQILSDSGNWIDQEQNLENNRKIENAILNKAKKIRLSQS